MVSVVIIAVVVIAVVVVVATTAVELFKKYIYLFIPIEIYSLSDFLLT